MNFDHYDNEVNSWLHLVLNSRTNDIETSYQCCNKLIDYGYQNSDYAILGFSHYYLSELCYFQNKITEFLNHLVKALEFQQIAKDWELLSRSYNLLGISSFIQGNIPLSLDYYLTGLELCEKNNQKHIAGMIHTNMGSMYFKVRDYKNAIKHLTTAKKIFEQDTSHPQYTKNIAAVYSFLADCYYRQNQLEASIEYLNKIDKMQIPSISSLGGNIYTFTIKTKVYYSIGEYEQSDKYLHKVIDLTKKQPALLDLQEDYFSLLYFLIDVKKYNEFLELLELFEVILSKANFANSISELAKLKITYYKAIGDEINLITEALNFYETSKLQEKETDSMSQTAIDFRISLEEAKRNQKEIERENALLQLQSKQDPLTKLANRSLLNEYSEEAFDRAYTNHTPLAVGIFDVDYFKQYNDTYGHQAGDNCLIQISDILREFMDREIFFARYGGDEFIYIAENKTDEEILQFAYELKEKITELNIEHKGSLTAPHVTISQGIRNSIPKPNNKMWDYLHAADTALYFVKGNRKNDVCLVHKLTPKNDEEVLK